VARVQGALGRRLSAGRAEAALAVAREKAAPHDPEAMQPERERGPEHAEPVAHRAAEVDRRRLREVARGARDLADAEAAVDREREHLVVEDEVVRGAEQRERREDLARERAVARVVLGELVAEEEVLDEREEAVRDVLPERHPALARADAEDARAEHDVEDAV